MKLTLNNTPKEIQITFRKLEIGACFVWTRPDLNLKDAFNSYRKGIKVSLHDWLVISSSQSPHVVLAHNEDDLVYELELESMTFTQVIP